MGRKKLPRQKKRPRPKELLQAWGGAKARTAAARQTGRGTDAAQKEMPQHCCLRLLPARQRPDRQGSAAALLWCIRPHFSVGPIAAGPPCPPPPFRTRGACPVDRWVEVFFPLRGRRPPPFGVRGAAAHWRPFSCARPGPARGKTVRPKAEKQGESQRTAKDRGEPAAGRKKNRERTARAQNGVQRRFGAHGRQRIWLPRAADA